MIDHNRHLVEQNRRNSKELKAFASNGYVWIKGGGLSKMADVDEARALCRELEKAIEEADKQDKVMREAYVKQRQGVP